MLLQEGFPVGMTRKIHMLPVIHSGTADMGIVQRKGDRFHQMELTFRAAANSSDIARILRDFRFNKYNMIEWINSHDYKSFNNS